MAKYDKRKFYWLQLKEDFFDEDAIIWLEEQPNGKEYCLFYLKLCLKSLKTNGLLIRDIGNGILVPYDAEYMSKLTKTEIDTVVVAVELLKQIGRVKILENGEIYLPDVENMIGQKSVGAFIKEQRRRLLESKGETKGGQKGDICPPDIDIELDIDIDKDIELDTNEKLTLDFVKTQCEKISPTLYARFNSKPNSNETLKKVLGNLAMTQSEFISLLEKANKTYVVLPKYDKLDLIWILNHSKEVMQTNDRPELEQKHEESKKPGRDYTREELNALIQNVDDIEI